MLCKQEVRRKGGTICTWGGERQLQHSLGALKVDLNEKVRFKPRGKIDEQPGHLMGEHARWSRWSS